VSEIVFILGAGASQEAGAPVVANFLDTAEELLKGGNLGEYTEDFERVFDARSKLQVVQSKAELDLDNIESIFATFEIGRLVNRLPNIESTSINPLLVSIRRLIVKTLEQTVSYPVGDKRIWPSHSYHEFAGLIKDLITKRHSCSIITFNYDYALDYALSFNGIPPDYCLSETKKGGAIPLIKLHGSLNWARCAKCGEIIPWNVRDYLAKTNAGLITHISTQPIHFGIGAQLRKSGIKHCEIDIEPDPVIVPPTWNKTEYHQALSGVWSHAALELSNATSIFVSGYSLSETDLFFRYLFALGSVGQTLIKRFWVFDPDTSDEVNKRFRALIGPGAKGKYKYVTAPFGKMFPLIRQEFQT
jgi:hypothetical protein